LAGFFICRKKLGSQEGKRIKYPQFIMGVLAQVKNGDEEFWK
jgi:hypothetical protein